MSDIKSEFSGAFAALTHHEPFPWQARLYEQLVAGSCPESCDIPTGLGKTAVMTVWLLALAEQVRSTRLAGDRPAAPSLPRRLVYVVNRRTVVDQATTEAVELAERLHSATGAPPASAREILSALSGDGACVLSVSTLRGARADAGEWRDDPARPAIIVGTVDMIGSRLLFAGYGSSYKMRPRDAGLLGQDTLFVHDEAHLTPRFGDLLRAIRAHQLRDGDPRPLRVLELTATRRSGEQTASLSLSDDDAAHPVVAQRIRARKILRIENVDDLASGLAATALRLGADSPRRVLVFVRSPDVASRVERQIRRDPTATDRTCLLTGTLRGFERDRLERDNPIFRHFLAQVARPPLDRSAYLVATSAGEVGVNLDADDSACDLTTLEGMIQRLGRVNRFGMGKARIQLLLAEPRRVRPRSSDNEGQDILTQRLAATLTALRALPGSEEGLDASPMALRSLGHREDAFSPEARCVPVTDIHLDRWSMTSIVGELPGREPVAPFLHGVNDDDHLPETHVAWRGDLELLVQRRSDLRQFGDRTPLHPQEMLRAPTFEVARTLLEMRQRFPTLCVARVDRGAWELLDLRSIAATDGDAGRRRLEEELRWATIVLPSAAGGLDENGTLRAEARPLEVDLDLGDIPLTSDAGSATGWRRLRARLARHEDDAWSAIAVTGARRETWALLSGIARGGRDEVLARIEAATGCMLERLVPIGQRPPDEDPSEYLALFLRRGRDLVDVSPHAAPADMELARHLDLAERHARDMARRAALGDLAEPVALAARWHDMGKSRDAWQRAIGVRSDAAKLAKTGRRTFDDRACGGYRHELGSLLDASRDAKLMARPDADLILHLIASHHGRARPHFDHEAQDRSVPTADNLRAMAACVDRFAHLQRRHGRWGLSWLEAVLHAADVEASTDEEGVP